MKQISIDALNAHLFEAIEGLKNNNDPLASPNEKMSIETAKAIADLGKVVVEGYKVKAHVISMAQKAENPTLYKSLAEGSGIINENK
ncbi:MAG: hypothetical protein PHD06_11250 [Bacteroidales bacterium]|nr:hypothetical protein [Bacteroidales bacterium]